MFQLINPNYNSGISSDEREGTNLLLNFEKENERFWWSQSRMKKLSSEGNVCVLFYGYSIYNIKIFVS